MALKIHLTFGILFLSYWACFAQVHLGPGQKYANIKDAVNVGAIKPGDTVYLHKGSYSGYQLVTNLKGSPMRWIVITRYQNDVIDISGGWQFVSCAYLRFQHLVFRGNAINKGRLFSVDNGGSCITQSKFIQVDSCYFSNTTDAAAIVAFKLAGVDSFVVSNNVFKDFPVCGAMDYNTCRNGVISGNRLENCLTGGHIKGGSSNILMERNIFINASQPSWVAFELGGDTSPQFYCPEDRFEVKNLKFFSNIIIGGYRGVALSSARECKVINNTFYSCGQATLRFLTTSILYPQLYGNIVENNIFAFDQSAYFNGGTQPADAVVFDKNIYYSIIQGVFNGPYWDSPALDLIKDKSPLNFGSSTVIFVDGPKQNFNLVKSSPAIGAGKNQTEPLLDYYGKPYSKGARSIGAIEFQANVGVVENYRKEPSRKLKIFPNPVSDQFIVKSESGNQKLELFNSLGNKLFNFDANQNVPILNLLPGIYFIKGNGECLKFIKN